MGYGCGVQEGGGDRRALCETTTRMMTTTTTQLTTTIRLTTNTQLLVSLPQRGDAGLGAPAATAAPEAEIAKKLTAAAATAAAAANPATGDASGTSTTTRSTMGTGPTFSASTISFGIATELPKHRIVTLFLSDLFPRLQIRKTRLFGLSSFRKVAQFVLYDDINLRVLPLVPRLHISLHVYLHLRAHFLCRVRQLAETRAIAMLQRGRAQFAKQIERGRGVAERLHEPQRDSR